MSCALKFFALRILVSPHHALFQRSTISSWKPWKHIGLIIGGSDFHNKWLLLVCLELLTRHLTYVRIGLRVSKSDCLVRVRVITGQVVYRLRAPKKNSSATTNHDGQIGRDMNPF